MSEKTYTQMRVKCKHDIEANWALAVDFSPLAGEIIIYDPDEDNPVARMKVGDGTTNVNDLPFLTEPAGTQIVASTTEPASPEAGMIWLDIS